jgi:hypothetical protein
MLLSDEDSTPINRTNLIQALIRNDNMLAPSDKLLQLKIAHKWESYLNDKQRSKAFYGRVKGAVIKNKEDFPPNFDPERIFWIMAFIYFEELIESNMNSGDISSPMEVSVLRLVFVDWAYEMRNRLTMKFFRKLDSGQGAQ